MTTTNEELNKAIQKVNAEIEEYTKRLEKIANGEDQEPTMVEGETRTGYYCQLMVDPKLPARIMLKHNYPAYKILGQDAPDAMWQEMGEEYGLATVCGVDF